MVSPDETSQEPEPVDEMTTCENRDRDARSDETDDLAKYKRIIADAREYLSESEAKQKAKYEANSKPASEEEQQAKYEELVSRVAELRKRHYELRSKRVTLKKELAIVTADHAAMEERRAILKEIGGFE